MSMYYFKNVLVALDGSELDNVIIRFTEYFARSSKVERIYFVNIIKSLNLPPEIDSEFPGMLQNALEERKNELRTRVSAVLTKPHITCEYLVEEGPAARRILDLTSKYNIDFVIVGRKSKLNGSGVLTQRLARRAACSLLIVPENPVPEPKRIMVPVDFSHYSRLAMEEAIAVAARASHPTEIIALNVFNVPVGYHYTGKSFEEFGEIMKKNAARDFERFMSSVDRKGMDISVIYHRDDDDEPVGDIYQEAIEEKIDLIIIGAKGRTSSTALFIGSMAERLIQLNNTIPMMVIRPKGKNAGWLEMLREI